MEATTLKRARVKAPADDGYFPKGGSMLREVHEARAVGLHYGQRTGLIGALDALLYEGTQQHTRDKSRPWKRLARTGMIMETVWFGTRAEADHELARVAAMHRRVHGTIDEPLGPHPTGTRYSAYTPELAFRTIGSVADSAYGLYETFVRRLSDGEREDLWQDYLLLGELFGLARSDCPGSYPEFRSVWDEWLAGDTLHLTPDARDSAIQTAYKQPLPWAISPFQRRANYLIITGTLPQRVRDIYELPWTRVHRAAFASLAATARAGYPLAPNLVRRGANSSLFELVARSEERRHERGRPSWKMT